MSPPGRDLDLSGPRCFRVNATAHLSAGELLLARVLDRTSPRLDSTASLVRSREKGIQKCRRLALGAGH